MVERLKSRSNGRVCESGGRLLVLRHRKDACGDHLVPAARFAEHRDQRAKGPVGMVEMGFVDRDQLPGDVTGQPPPWMWISVVLVGTVGQAHKCR